MLFGKPVLLTVLLTVLLLTVSTFFLQGFSPQVWVKGCVQTKNGQKMDRDTEIEIEEKEISRDQTIDRKSCRIWSTGSVFFTGGRIFVGS